MRSKDELFSFADIRVPGAPPPPPPDPDLEARAARLALYKELSEWQDSAKHWRDCFFGLLSLVLLVILIQWFHHNDAPANRDAIPSQAWSFGEPGQ